MLFQAPFQGTIQWEYPFLQKDSMNPNDPTYNELPMGQNNIPAAPVCDAGGGDAAFAVS